MKTLAKAPSSKLQAPKPNLEKAAAMARKRLAEAALEQAGRKLLARRIARLIFGDAKQLVHRCELTNERGWGEEPVANLIERELNAAAKEGGAR